MDDAPDNLPDTFAAHVLDAAGEVGLGGSQFLASDAAKRRTPPLAVPQGHAGSDARRDDINQALLAQARRNYPSLMNGVRTEYSAYLEGLQQRTNADLRTEGNRFHSQAVILDPAKYDAGIALGIRGPETVGAQLQAQGAATAPGVPEMADARMSSYYPTKFGNPTYTQAPTALQNPNNGGGLQACVVAPASDYAMIDGLNIPGLSTADRIKFLDRHETWHCRDDRYSMAGINPDDLKTIDPNNDKTLADNAAGCKVLATLYQKEAFADTGAIGSMLREGYDMSLLDKVANWRKGSPADTIHITTPVLQGLKQEIEDIGGIDRFRALSDAQAKELYYKTVDKYGVSGPAVQTALKYKLADPLQTIGHQIDAVFDRDSSKGIDFYRYFSATGKPAPGTSLTADQQRQLDAYNPQASMEDQAFSTSGKVTPETMIGAYTRMQDQFRTLIKQHPEDPLYPQEMAKLQKAFTDNLQRMDYAAVNNRYGVKIENVEPSLAAFSGGQQRPAAPRMLPPAIKP